MPIREWQESDLPQILDLLSELSATIDYEYHGDLSILKDQYRNISGYPDIFKSFVFEENFEILGFISLVFYVSVLHHKGTALINELVTKETARGKGIGKTLLRHAIEYSKKNGWDDIEVGVESFNKEAIEFYKKNGLDEEYVLLGKEFIQ